MAFWKKMVDGSFKPADDNDNSDIEFKPEKLKEDITNEVKSSLSAFETKNNETLKPILEMAAQIKADRESRAEAARKAEENKNNKENEVTSEDFMLDPAEAVRRQMQGTNTAVMMLAARAALRETLEDKEYYYGDIKQKVDAMVAQQPLPSQCRADVIQNAYKLVMFDHMKEVQEGKIKARNTSAIFEGGSTGGHDGKKADDANESMTADEKLVASKMGISDKDWISSRRELSYV
jgi:hypothetical protein